MTGKGNEFKIRSVIKEVNYWALIGSSSWFLFKFFTPQAGRSNKITTNCLRTASNFQNPFIRMGMSDSGWIIFTYGNWAKSFSGSRSRSRFCSRTTYTGWLIWIGPNQRQSLWLLFCVWKKVPIIVENKANIPY